MASWWTAADVLDSLDLEEDSIVARVVQAVGLFGDILSLEDIMLSDAQPEHNTDGPTPETGSEARRVPTEEEQSSGAAKSLNGDIHPTSPSGDKETEGRPTVTDTKSVDARLDLRDEERKSSEEQERLETTPLTSFPASGHPGEPAADIQDITAELRTGCRLEAKVSLMDAAAGSPLRAGGGRRELSPTANSSGTNPEMEAKEDKEEGSQNSLSVNSEADGKKNGSHQSSKYKTVSFRRIRRGNTRQRIDEFEAMMDV
ncbi:uncharacterized protein PEZ65_022918 [Lycodopsis pacificus]